MAASRSRNSARSASGSRVGRLVPTVRCFTTPSTRKKLAAIRRAPWPRRASEAQRWRPERQQRGLDLLDLGEAAGEAPLRHAARRLEPRRDGRLGAPHQPVEPRQHVRAEPRRDRPARPREQVADPQETGAGEARHAVGVDPQRRDGERRHEGLEPGLVRGGGERPGAGAAGRPGTGGVEPRQGPGGLGRRGDRRAGREPLTAEPAHHGLDEPRFPAEEVEAPATSSTAPSRPSGAASGVKRLHQSTTAAISAASASGSASATSTAGQSARASASARPGRRPRAAACASTAISRCAPFTLATVTSGSPTAGSPAAGEPEIEDGCRPARRSRSVGSSGRTTDR